MTLLASLYVSYMVYTILQLVFMASVSVIIIMIIRKLPLIDGFEFSESTQTRKNGHRIIRSEVVDAIDQRLAAILAKILRRSKLILMRLDNFVAKHLEAVKQRSGSHNKNGVNVIEAVHEQREEKNDTEETSSQE